MMLLIRRKAIIWRPQKSSLIDNKNFSKHIDVNIIAKSPYLKSRYLDSITTLIVKTVILSYFDRFFRLEINFKNFHFELN